MDINSLVIECAMLVSKDICGYMTASDFMGTKLCILCVLMFNVMMRSGAILFTGLSYVEVVNAPLSREKSINCKFTCVNYWMSFDCRSIEHVY